MDLVNGEVYERSSILVDWFREYEPWLRFAGATVLIACISASVYWTVKIGIPGLINAIKRKIIRDYVRTRGDPMTRKEREAYVQRMIEDAFGDALDDLEEKGIITREEMTRMHRKLTKGLNFQMMPRALPPRTHPLDINDLKLDIKGRLGNGQLFKAKLPDLAEKGRSSPGSKLAAMLRPHIKST